jgi:NAD(P)-dependent dehydrogenase (short-subunit alcohol dehydrogenase family)
VLAAEGAAVVFSGRIHEPVTATEAAIQVNGGKAVGVVADMTTREGALRIVRTAQEHFSDPEMKVPHLEDPMPAVNIRVAVNAVMKTLAQEYGPYGITANVIATGPFDSELSRDYRASGTGVKTEEWYRAMLPAGRWGNPVEMGWLAAFLCSERAASRSTRAPDSCLRPEDTNQSIARTSRRSSEREIS